MQHSLTDLDGLKVSAEDLLAAAREKAAQPIWIVGPEGRIRFANPAAVAALGYDSAQELLGRDSHETIRYRHPDETPDSAAEWPMLLPWATGQTVATDLDWFARRDGSMFPVSYVSVPIEMPDGRGVVVAFTGAGNGVRGVRSSREHEAMLAAQRRVATLVAGGAASAEVFGAIAREVGHVTGLSLVAVWRFAADGATGTVMGAWGERAHPFQAGTRWPLDGPTIAALVLKTGRAARIDDLADVPGTIARTAREAGIRSVAGAPIIVDGETWGVMVTASAHREPLPDHIEDRIAGFTELVAAAIANAESRARLARLAEEQAALRRVATLVAGAAPPEELFTAVVEEVGRVLPVQFVAMARYESDDTMTVVATSSEVGDRFPVGGRWTLGGKNVSTIVAQTGRPARVDTYADASGGLNVAIRERGLHSSVGTPIVVQGRVWGVMTASSGSEQLLPADTEARLASFTELVATAISNTDARMQAGRLAEEQAALRRVATLVAQAVAPDELFEAVTREVGQACGADLARMERYEADGTVTALAAWTRRGEARLAVGTRFSLGGASIAMLVRATGRPARVDSFAGAEGPIAQEARELGIRASVGCPIIAGGGVWGVIAASTCGDVPFPAGTESQIGEFTELIATAVSNAEANAELVASRARILTTGDEARRRLVRDLHDGAQQRLVHMIVRLKLAQQELPEDDPAAPILAEALAQAEQGNAELRELAHGVLPSVLTRRGLRAGVGTLVSRVGIPVTVEVPAERLPPGIEASAYFVVAEALTNVVKHAQAQTARVTARVERGALHVDVRDDGVGGAHHDGPGLLGLEDRISAIGGALRVKSPPGGGTTIAATLPLPLPAR